jgi:hypothetical protein
VLDKDVDGSANIAGHLKQVESALADLHREGASKSNMKKVRGFFALHCALFRTRARVETYSSPVSLLAFTRRLITATT